MAIFTRAAFFYIVNLVVTLIMFKGLQVGFSGVPKSWQFWVGPFIVILAGLITMIAWRSKAKKMESTEKIFTISLIIFSAAYTGLFFQIKFANLRKERDFGNIESNKSYLTYFVVNNHAEVQIALNSLNKIKSGPNSFRLNGHYSAEKDTLLNGLAKKFYIIQLRYRDQYDDNIYKAEFRILFQQSTVLLYDKLLDQSDWVKVDIFNNEIREILKSSNIILSPGLQRDFKELNRH